MQFITELIKRFVAPALPSPTQEYSQPYFDRLLSILRLYFNQLDELLSSNVVATRNASKHGQFFSTATQVAAATNTAYAVTFNNASAFNTGVALRSPSTSEVVVDTPSVYNCQFSVQLDKTSGGSANFWVWWRLNGVNVPDSASQIQIQGNNHEIFGAANLLLRMNPGDYVQLMWAVSDTTVQLQYFAAAGVVPAIPSVILTVDSVTGIV